MLRDIRSYDGIYLACGATDMRLSINGLSQLVKQTFGMDPFGNGLYLFCNKNRNRLKGLSWDKNGFTLYYKRLDGMGARFQWPRLPGDLRNISIQQVELLLEGYAIDPPKGFGEVAARDYY